MYGGEMLHDPSAGVKQFFQWLISFRDPLSLFHDNPFLVVCEVGAIGSIAVLLTISVRKGPEHVIYLLAGMAAGLAYEIFGSFHYPRFPLWWYQPTIATLLGWRIPIALPFQYTIFGYMSWTTSLQMALPAAAEACLTALLYVLHLMAFELLTVKCLMWSWHNSDPYTEEKFYGVAYADFIVVGSIGGAVCLLHRVIWDKLVMRYSTLQQWRFYLMFPAFIGASATLLAGVVYVTLIHVLKEQLGISQNIIFILYMACYLAVPCLAGRIRPPQKHRDTGNNRLQWCFQMTNTRCDLHRWMESFSAVGRILVWRESDTKYRMTFFCSVTGFSQEGSTDRHSQVSSRNPLSS